MVECERNKVGLLYLIVLECAQSASKILKFANKKYNPVVHMHIHILQCFSKHIKERVLVSKFVQ